jgi:hypothetical protein
MRRTLALLVAVLLLGPGVAHAQPSPKSSHHTPAWIAVGAGAGFGIGVWAGLTRFDESINSDRKIWTTAIVSATAGGLLGYLLTRKRPTATGARGAKGAASALGATGANGALGASRCDRCAANLSSVAPVALVAPVVSAVPLALLAPVAPSAPLRSYSLLSPISGDTRDAFAAGR